MSIVVATLVGLLGIALNVINPTNKIFESYYNAYDTQIWRKREGVSDADVYAYARMRSVAWALIGASGGVLLFVSPREHLFALFGWL